jgi:hypothetical protein
MLANPSPDSSSPAGQKAVEQMLLSWATWRYRHRYYDEPLLRQFLRRCRARRYRRRRDQYPAGKRYVDGRRIFLSEARSGNRPRRFGSHPRLDRIDVQKYELSKLVLSRISNILISPRHFDQWGAEKAKKITDAFVGTVQSQQDVGEDVDFMLF